MPEVHLKLLGFMWNACGTFTKNKERTKKIKGAGDSKYNYQNELDKACFRHDMVYGILKI